MPDRREPDFDRDLELSGFYSSRPRRGSSTASRVGITILLLLAGVAGGAWFLVREPAAADATAAELLDRAIGAHIEGRLADAAELYREVLLEEPGNKFAHYNLGLLAQNEGRLADAEASYRIALQTDPQYVPALFNLAIIRYDAGDYREAVDLYRLVLSVQPDNAPAHLNLGYALIAFGQEAAGRAEIAEAGALDPSLAGAIGSTPRGVAGSDASSTTTTSTPEATTTEPAPEDSSATVADQSPTTTEAA